MAEHGWLSSRHTFSFADYYDPRYMGFRALRVINEDWVQPSEGFDTHPHRDMEIITYVLDGALEHKDSLGTGSVIRPGEVQRMTAGTGVLHSEFNHSKTSPVHLLQIWLLPEKRGLKPSYEQKNFPVSEREGKLRLIASHDGRDGSVTVNQDVELYAGILAPGEKASKSLAPGRHAWIQLASGRLSLNGEELQAGDGVAVSDETKLDFMAGAGEKSEFLVFDLA